MSKYRERLHWLYYQSETAPVRFWFGAASLGFGSFMMFSHNVVNKDSEYYFMIQLASPSAWAAMFFIHAISLWYGVITEKYNKFLLMSEGVLGTAVWFAAAASVAMYTGVLGGTFAGALIALWILIRYPTHWEWDHA